MLSERDALLASIIENPKDYGLRLILADKLMELGEEYEREEFIRVQCQIPTMPETIVAGNRCPICDRPGHWRRGVGFDHEKRCGDCEEVWEPGETIENPKLKALRIRERELWVPPLSHDMIDSVYKHGLATLVLPGMPHPDARYFGWGMVRRGFVSEVRCRFSTWIGGTCDECNGEQRVGQHYDPASDTMRGGRTCGHCNGTGRVNAHGPRLVREHPIEVVRAANRKPFHHSGRYGWWSTTVHPSSAFDQDLESDLIPSIIHVVSDGYIRYNGRDNRQLMPHEPPRLKWYNTEEEAQTDLSDAMIKWAKQQSIGVENDLRT